MYSDEYDDGPDGPFDQAGGSALSQAGERLVRKRSSKGSVQSRRNRSNAHSTLQLATSVENPSANASGAAPMNRAKVA